MKNVDQLIEMAIEFSDFEIENLDDTELQRMLAKERAIVYVPIPSNKFWDVMHKGMQINPLRKAQNPRDKDFYLDQREASDMAHVLATGENEIQGNEDVQPLLLVAEKKILAPTKKGASMVQNVMAMSGIGKVPMIDGNIRPQDIVSVVYPAEGNTPDIPIRKFIQSAKRGDYEPGIPSSKASGLKTGRPTPPPWQHVILKYAHNVLNYSTSRFDYLIGPAQADLGRTILREATKVGLSKMWYWTGEDFARWLYSLLPPLRDDGEDDETTIESEIENMHSGLDHEGFNLPLHRVFDKYKDEWAYDVRRGKITPEPRG